MNKKTLVDLDFEGKRVFCRVDFNVPLKDGVVTDDTRIRAVLPTIDYLVKHGAKVILASHLGRPEGQVVEELRLTPVADKLREIVDYPVNKVDQAFGSEVEKVISEMKNGEVLLLENVRFYPGEQNNDVELAKAFADLADIYVNDAFGTAHRSHASTEGIGRYLPSVAGFLMEQELDVLSKALKNPARPFTAIIGGSKVADKIDVIENLLDIVDHLIIGGGLAWTFTKAQGYEIGCSLLEADKIELARSFMEKAKEKGVQFHVPVDAVVAEKFAPDAASEVVSVDNIPKDSIALDIGPETSEKYRQIICQSELVIWNGPMGVFEFDKFANGTKVVAQALADNKSVYAVVGGGDSAAAAEKFNLADKMDHVSTGGGASLRLMEGKELPGITILDDCDA